MEPRPKVNVLLVDDQPSNLLALEALLSAEGLNLVRAPTGEQALMRVLDEDYAAILMDVHMPGMDGFETAELIRQRDRSKHTPILFLTAFQSTEAQIHRGYALGAVDFLSKPVVATVLRSKVAVFVELFLKNEQVKRQAAHLVENERQEHQRALAEEKRRWEMERLREEAAKEKRVAEKLARKAEELTRSIEERVRAEEQLRQRAAQQAVVAGLGQRALAGTDLGELLDEAVRSVAGSLGVEFGRVVELTPEGDRLVMRAGTGWRGGSSGHEAVEAGSRLARRLHPVGERAGGRGGPPLRDQVCRLGRAARTRRRQRPERYHPGPRAAVRHARGVHRPPEDLRAGRRPLPPGRRQRPRRGDPASAR